MVSSVSRTLSCRGGLTPQQEQQVIAEPAQDRVAGVVLEREICLDRRIHGAHIVGIDEGERCLELAGE